jgi:hypothetical protein
MVESVILSSTYLGPVQWFQKLFRYRHCYLERCDHFVKQTYRNRCRIATTSGVQDLTVPVEVPAGFPDTAKGKVPMSLIGISEHGNWRHLHWNALCSAYGESPFFEFYADDLKPFYDKKWISLFDFNLALLNKVCELLDMEPNITLTDDYHTDPAEALGEPIDDFRDAIRPKHPLPDPDFQPQPYYQVYRQKYGFIPNLSILDLLFNEGNEAVFFL